MTRAYRETRRRVEDCLPVTAMPAPTTHGRPGLVNFEPSSKAALGQVMKESGAVVLASYPVRLLYSRAQFGVALFVTSAATRSDGASCRVRFMGLVMASSGWR